MTLNDPAGRRGPGPRGWRDGSYAPLFANYDHTQWNPDLIGYDQTSSFGSTSCWVQQMFARNVGDKVLPVTASASGLYYSATIDSKSGQVYLKIVNPGSQDVPGQLSFGGRDASAASIEVLAHPDPQAGNTLAAPDAVVPARGTLHGSKGVFSYLVPTRGTLHGSKGVFSYLVPANSLTVVRVAR